VFVNVHRNLDDVHGETLILLLCLLAASCRRRGVAELRLLVFAIATLAVIVLGAFGPCAYRDTGRRARLPCRWAPVDTRRGGGARAHARPDGEAPLPNPRMRPAKSELNMGGGVHGGPSSSTSASRDGTVRIRDPQRALLRILTLGR